MRRPMSRRVTVIAGTAAGAEVLAKALYLLGPDASFVNGIALPVDGGRTFH